MALVGRIAHFAVEATTGATERGLSYRARDERTGDAVLLRAFPRHEFEGQGLERLRRVIAALEGAPRSALVNFSETWMDDSCTWIVRPFLEGPTLGDLPRHSITVDAAIDLTDAMAELLGAAHARGVVHGHVRLSNFVFADATRQSGLSVVDFGLTLDRQHAPTATDDWIGLGRVLYGMLGQREPDPRAPEVLRTLNPDVTPDLSSLVSDLLNGRAQRGTDLKISAPIRAALYLDTEIDKDTEVACNQVVEDELSGYGAQALNLDRMTTSAEMMRSLVRPLTQHLVYFCCHASLEGDGTRIDAEDAYLALTDRDYRIGPSRLNSWLGQSLFTSGPVVFMNACESGQMNSLFYQGFVPTFLNRRASALVGAQTEIPAVFAGQFAKSFLARFFSGGSNNVVGQILFDLRRNFIDVQKNPLGLLYCVYRGADVHLASALVREPPAKNGGQGI